MTERTNLDSRLDALIDLGTVEATELGEGSTVIATLVGDAPPDLDGAADEDVERVANVDLWGDAALLSRPADPNDDGACEAVFVRTGDTREIVGTRDRRWTVELEKGEALVRYCGDVGGEGQPTVRPMLHLHADGSIDLYADVVRIAKDDGTRLRVDRANDAIDLVAATVNLASASPADAMALASKCNDALDSINGALDALANGVPVPNDGGAALQTAFKVAWPGTPPASPSDVGSTKVLAD